MQKRSETISIVTSTIKPTLSINEQQIQRSFENVIQQHFTLSMLYRYIDEIHISKNKSLVGIYFKMNR